MKEYSVLTINPGSSSTKMGLVRGGRVVFDRTVDHQRSEFAACKTFAEQEPIRMRKILEALEEEGVELSSIDAVAGRGVGLYACEGGTYEISELAYQHAVRDVAEIHHPATLGIVISYKLGRQLGKPAFFVNPMPIDELCDEARMTGVKGLYRPARSHPLNQKQVAIHHSQRMGKRYEDCNYVILHMGGGTSITAHRKGRAIDSSRAGDGQGPISPNRCGDVCVDDVATLMKRGMTMDEIYELASNRGGLVSLLGTDDLRAVKEMIRGGNRLAKLAYDAMIYTMAKWTGMMAGALKGDVDAILMTGGMAKDEELVARLTEAVNWIAPVYVYPGSFETQALGAGAIRVLSGHELPRVYSGKPVWSGFDFL